MSPLDSSARARRSLSDWRCEQLDVRQSVSRCFVGCCICSVLKEAWESGLLLPRASPPSQGWYRGRHAPAASARPDAWLPGCLDARSRRQYLWTYRSCRDPCTYVAAGKASPLSSIPRLTFSSSLHFTFSMVPSKLPYLCTRTFNTAQPCPSTPPVFAPVLPWMQPSIHQHATALGQS